MNRVISYVTVLGVLAWTSGAVLAEPAEPSSADGAKAAVIEAERAAEAGDADAVMFALAGVDDLDEELTHRAVAAMNRGAEAAVDEDPIIALHLAQTALRHRPADLAALTMRLEATRALGQLPDPAWVEALTDAHPEDPVATTTAAEAALALGDRFGAIQAALGLLENENLAEDLRRRATAVVERAEAELAEMEEDPEALAALEASVQEALAEARERIEAGDLPGSPEGSDSEATAGDGEVVLYVTEWCGVCDRASAWLERQGVPFVERDIEKSAAAARELERKAESQGVPVQGVPMIDVAGELMAGFSESRLRTALRREGLLP